MSPTLIDLLLCGLAYVVISYFLGVWSKARQEPRQGFTAAGRSDQQASGIAARLHDLQLMRMGLPAFLGEPVSEGGRQNIRHAPI